MTVAAVPACLCKTVSRNGSLELRNGKGDDRKNRGIPMNAVEEARNEKREERGARSILLAETSGSISEISSRVTKENR